MPVMNFDLEDGLPPVSFSLKSDDCDRFMAFMAECQAIKEAQPKREWVGLTDEDRQAAFESLPDMLDGFLHKWGWLHFSKAIEAKLKEKNTQ